ncbi:MAG: glycerophosphodiester phosphodiesterase family protein [Planctomycetaceae bacterium]
MSDQYPENTKAAFQAAINQQADAIECDLQFTADQRIVVCHDETFERYGHPAVRVATATADQLRSLDMGSWFHPDFCDERLMTADELLNEFSEQIPLLLEIKNSTHSGDVTDAFLTQLVSLVTRHDAQHRVAMLCFDPGILQRLHELAPWATLVLNTDEPQRLGPADLRRQSWLDAVDGNIGHLTQPAIQLFQEQGLSTQCFTCDSESDVLKAWDLGIDTIITNDPARTHRLLHEHRSETYET